MDTVVACFAVAHFEDSEFAAPQAATEATEIPSKNKTMLIFFFLNLKYFGRRLFHFNFATGNKRVSVTKTFFVI